MFNIEKVEMQPEQKDCFFKGGRMWWRKYFASDGSKQKYKFIIIWIQSQTKWFSSVSMLGQRAYFPEFVLLPLLHEEIAVTKYGILFIFLYFGT